MFRTRDFLLVVIVFFFLVLLVAFTYSQKQISSNSESLTQGDFPPEITTVTANVDAVPESSLSREDRFERLKAKIESSELVSVSAPDSIEVVSTEEIVATSSDLSQSKPFLCQDYRQLTRLNWPISEIQSEVVEGSRRYYTEFTATVGTSSSTTVNKNVLLTLASQFIPFGEPSCIKVDVIGVALDNSLIRNNETALYGIFGNETLIGYALDGFPIYGSGSNVVDECGGRIELGQYRYEIASDREVVLNCFAGKPQSL